MKLAAALLAVAITACPLVAADGPMVRKLTAPKGVTLDAANQALLDRANVYVEHAYGLLKQGQPGQAADELRKALTLQRRLAVLKPELIQAGLGDMRSMLATSEDKIEDRGGIEKLLEIAAVSGEVGADDYDYNGLHLRKVVKETRDIAKELEIKQGEITAQVRELNHKKMGGGGAKPQPNLQAQGAAGEEAEKPGQQDDQRAAAPNAAEGVAKDGAEAAGKAGAPNAGAQGAQAAQAKDGQQTAAAQGAKPDAAGGQPGDAVDLAAQQDAVARALAAQAEKLRRQGGGGDAAATAFDAAARAATETAQHLREGDVEVAEATSRNAERMIAAAHAGANQSGAQAASQAVAALGQRLDDLQRWQEKTLAAARELAAGNAGGGDEGVKRDHGIELMLEQGKVKMELDAVTREMHDLGQALGQGEGDDGNRAENAARDALAQAGKALKDARAGQQAVNATIALKDGDAARAAEAMAKVGAALGQARAGVDNADQALTGGGAPQLARGLAELKQVSAELRRLGRAADAATKGDERGEPDGTKHGTSDPNHIGHEGPATGDKGGAGGPGQTRTLSPTLGKALDASAAKLEQRLRKTMTMLEATAPDAANELRDQLKTPLTFAGDLDESLKRVATVVQQTEQLEALINRMIEQEREGQAAHGFLKDPIPAGYQRAVADYLCSLAADEPGR